MNFLIKKIYIILLLSVLLVEASVHAKESKIQYKKENISNYFSGIVSINQSYNKEAFKHLNKVKSLKNRHINYNIEFVRTLVLLEKYNQAYKFSKSAWSENELVFEIDLLLGLDYFLKEDYINAEKHFKRLNKISRYNLYFNDFIGNILLAWSKASQGKKEESFKFIEKVPRPYLQVKNTQNVFLQCYFDDPLTLKSFEELVNNENYNFSRYNFFLISYLIYNNEKIKNFFNCKNPRDSIAELFYVIGNLYSSEEDFKLSNFYLKISNLLNDRFSPNSTLIAENYYHQNKKEISKKIYESLKSIGSIYSWHASRSIAAIILDLEGKESSASSLKREFNLLSSPSFEHYFELANFYKDNDYFEESIKYYTLALNKIEKDHFLVSKILARRGASFERIGDWENAEKDLIKSLEISPDEAHVLNYLAYTWIDKGINLDRGLKMLKKANKLKENDGYIIDSLGWAYYAKENYLEAEIFLQRAVELLPGDPIINDHYADTLWMLNKNIQARYFWTYILKLDSTEKELKDIINNKLIFGITKKL